MSWAEFVLRSIAFREDREREEQLFRAVAYQSYCNQFVLGKGKPKALEAFWPIGKKKVSKQVPEAFKRQLEAYKNRNNGG